MPTKGMRSWAKARGLVLSRLNRQQALPALVGCLTGSEGCRPLLGRSVQACRNGILQHTAAPRFQKHSTEPRPGGKHFPLKTTRSLPGALDLLALRNDRDKCNSARTIRLQEAKAAPSPSAAAPQYQLAMPQMLSSSSNCMPVPC